VPTKHELMRLSWAAIVITFCGWLFCLTGFLRIDFAHDSFGDGFLLATVFTPLILFVISYLFIGVVAAMISISSTTIVISPRCYFIILRKLSSNGVLLILIINVLSIIWLSLMASFFFGDPLSDLRF